MRARGKTVGITGAIVGLVLALGTVAAPAWAGKPGGSASVAAASATCATFEGLVVTASSVSYGPVALAAGESIKVTVSPARTTDKILLSAGLLNGSTLYSSAATAGLTFTATYSTSHYFGWSLQAVEPRPTSITWTFDCSSSTGGTGGSGGTTAPADDDRDGVVNSIDYCSGTVLPDSVSKPTAGSYFANRAGAFVDGTGRAAGITVIDAGGCSATQIAKSLGLSKRVSQAGISLSTLQSWASTH